MPRLYVSPPHGSETVNGPDGAISADRLNEGLRQVFQQVIHRLEPDVKTGAPANLIRRLLRDAGVVNRGILAESDRDCEALEAAPAHPNAEVVEFVDKCKCV